MGAGGSYFINYDKVAIYTTKLASSFINKINATLTELETIEVLLAAHFDLVSIHPFYEGNGRTSRLQMNYIQALKGLPLAIVFNGDKAGYFGALQEARKNVSTQTFYDFMYQQYKNYLTTEI